MTISLEELEHCIQRSGPGLVAGPGLTASSDLENQFFSFLKQKHSRGDSDVACKNHWDFVDLLLKSSATTSLAIHNDVEQFFANRHLANPQLNGVVKGGWSAVISLCCDDFLRMALEEHFYQKPWKWKLTTIAEPDARPASSTVPFYSLMGDIRDRRTAAELATSRAGLLTRMRAWPRLLKTLPNIVKSDPLIFIGTENFQERVCDFLNALLALEPFVPGRLIFLQSDPTAASPTLLNLVSQICTVDVVDCTTTELATALSRKSTHSRVIKSTAATAMVRTENLLEIEDQVGYIPKKTELKVDSSEHNRLLDALFRPTHLDWSPYVLDMEFKRDASASIADLIKRSTEHEFSRIIHVEGEAGIGKTVVMRSAAFALAQEGFLCLWVRRSYSDMPNRFDQVVSQINKGILQSAVRTVFFLDDPSGNRIQLADLVTALSRARFKWQVVIATRKTDELLLAETDRSILGEKNRKVTVATDFSDGELQRLPQYLVQLGIATDLAAASKLMLVPHVKHSKDVLCSLWYLLPQTKGAIEVSLVGEYQRLGSIADVVQGLASAAGRKGVAKKAYELITVASGFDNTPVPEEVLVSALRISHTEWASQCKEQKPLWGLLYSEFSHPAESWVFRTRNHVVTEVLLRAINQGTTGHTGEFRCLKELLGACTSHGVQYKTFILDILVHRRNLMENRFALEQIMELYDTALSSFPAPLLVAEHHKTVAKRHKGGNLQEVYNDLLKLLARSTDGVPDQDSPENLHTSAAATLQKMVKEGLIDVEEGAECIFGHLSRALEQDQFSFHAHHIHATSLLKLANQLRGTNTVAFAVNMERAARIINRAHLLAKHFTASSQPDEQMFNTLRLFSDLRDEIISVYRDMDEAQREAIAIFEKTKEQHVMALVIRAMLTRALDSNKGSHYKKTDEYIRECVKAIGRVDLQIGHEILLCRAELVMNWQLANNRGPVFWEQFETDLLMLAGSSAHANDLVIIFYLAVAKYNLGKFGESESLFQSIRNRPIPRDAKRVTRCCYLGDGANPKILEGRVRKGVSDNVFIYSGALGHDVRAKKGQFKVGSDEVQHFTVDFTFTGPLATRFDIGS